MIENEKHKVMVAMSGGVDSSVAALLLMEQGYDVAGTTLKLFSGENVDCDSSVRTCCSLRDVEDARRVAYKLGFEHFVFNFGPLFKSAVIERFAKAYVSGETPNPCIDCNRYIKFSKLLERARLMNMDYIATGHYARVVFDESTGRYLLKKAADKSKDQTYVLYALTQEQLKRTLFPLGGLLKSEVRALAERQGLVNSQKPDSQDICFVPDGDYTDFLEKTLQVRSSPGAITDMDGHTLGMHQGLIRYTIGQRKGLNVSLGKPKYVIEKDVAANTLVIGDDRALYREDCLVRDINLISMNRLDRPVLATVKTRYGQKEADAVLNPVEDGHVFVRFVEPQRAITPGQAAVFYDGDSVIGGGTIV